MTAFTVMKDTAADVAVDGEAARRFTDNYILPVAERFDGEGRIPTSSSA